MPGPAVAVIARAPAQLAPITMPSEAISSSACTIANVALPVSFSIRYFFMYPISDSQSDDEGVIGYQATTVTPAIMQPIAAAVLPSIRLFPAVSFIGSIANGSFLVKFVSAKSQPALGAPGFRATGLPLWPRALVRGRSIS